MKPAAPNSILAASIGCRRTIPSGRRSPIGCGRRPPTCRADGDGESVRVIPPGPLHAEMSRRPLSVLTRGIAAAALFLTLAFAVRVVTILRPPSNADHDPLIVNDVTGLNPTKVDEVIAPTTPSEIAAA